MNTIKGFLFNFIFAFVFMVISFMILPLVSYANQITELPKVNIENGTYDFSTSKYNFHVTITNNTSYNVYGVNLYYTAANGNRLRLLVGYSDEGIVSYSVSTNNTSTGGSSSNTFSDNQFNDSVFVASGNPSHNSGKPIIYDGLPTIDSPYDLSGSLSRIHQGITDGMTVSGVPSTEPLGVIKPKYSANGSDTTASTFREYVEWEPLSTSGFDITGAGVGVQFAIKDKSYYHNHRLGQPSNLYDFIYSRVSWLTSYVYPYGSSQRSWLQGQSTNSALYGKMRVIGEAMGSTLQYGFSTWSFYANQNVDSKLSTFGNALLNNNTSSIMDTVMATSDANASVCLSYDIYARIHDGGGQRYGNWLKINKHSVPVDQQSNRLNGGVTKEPVIIPGFNPSNNDWFDTDDEIPSDDPDDEDDEPLPTGINDPNDGSPTYIYNNYTYNYDNRTWIENHYDNQTVDDVNTALDWIKLFPRFFGLFMTFFGTFLPGWAAVCVTVFIPILCGLLVFKVIKGVIPFV